MPSWEELGGIRARTHEVLREEVTALLESRRAAWKEWTRVSWATDKTAVYNLVRDGDKSPVSVLARENGSLTGSIKEMDELLRKHWLPVFQKYCTTNPEPAWGDFMSKYGAYIPQGPQIDLGPLDAQALWHTIQRMSASSSTGADGWSVSDLKRFSWG